jgi:hypothetical protein
MPEPDRIEAPAYAATMNERQYQDLVLEAAAALGYRCYHTHLSVRSARGFPDLVCVREGDGERPGRLVVLEIKAERGRATPHQEAWIAALASVPGVAAMVARPSDWDAVVEALRGPSSHPTG